MGSFAGAKLMKRIVVTGGAGFIGSHSVDLLLAQGMRVVVFDNLLTGKLSNLNQHHPHLVVVREDILNYDALAKEVSQSDAVLHLAALPSVPKSIEDPIQSLQVNLQGLVHVLQAIRASQKNIRLVYASSAAVYGDTTHLPCRDNKSLSEFALSPYALEKANNERYADLFFRLFGIKSLGLRYFNVYGPRQDPSSPYSGVISKFISNYQAKQPILIFGDGKQSRDFIHVSDIARANLLALLSDCDGVMNIATGVPETLLDLVKYVENYGKEPLTVNFATARSGDIRESYADVKKAKKVLGFQYEVSLEEGIRQMMQPRALDFQGCK
jgi:UDP-glucose 4-epimerase